MILLDEMTKLTLRHIVWQQNVTHMRWDAYSSPLEVRSRKWIWTIDIEEWLKNVAISTQQENDVYSNHLWLKFGGEKMDPIYKKYYLTSSVILLFNSMLLVVKASPTSPQRPRMTYRCQKKSQKLYKYLN